MLKDLANDEALICRYCNRNLTTGQTEATSSNSGGNVLAVISILCGIVGFFVAGIVLGVIAIVTGIVAIALGSRGGIGGMFLGILDIVAVLCVLSSF